MDIFELTTHPIIKGLVQEQNTVSKQKALAGYNLFTISSYNSYLENFHSDIIASILDPNALHSEKNTFLFLFIDYLKNVYNAKLDKKHYLNAKVFREKGRIDIWIMDETSSHSFFIENKINGAIDRDRQVEDYYEYVVGKKYEVDVIIYLSKDGSQIAPKNDLKISSLIMNIPAYINLPKDLYSGWLQPCLKACSSEDSRSFIHQYSKLISHLSNKNMENSIKEKFYDFVNTENALSEVQQIHELYPLLPVYRAECFSNATEDHTPFQRRFKFQNNYYIFEKYVDTKGSYKLDVFFNLNGSASVVLWNTTTSGTEGYESVRELLTKIQLINEFSAPSKFNGWHCEFLISDRYPTMSEIDKAVLILVKSIFEKLRLLNIT